MSISDEINRIKTNIANAYDKAEEKGATLPTVKNSNNLASTIESITGGGEEWQPEPDWWDIEKILEEDEEDYPAKVIWLMDEGSKDFYVYNYNILNCDKIITSDGQTIISSGLYKINENGFKYCSKGYKTFYAIAYLKTTIYNCSYASFPFFYNVRYMYIYNADTLNWNSAFNFGNYTSPKLEAIKSNKVLKGISSNNSIGFSSCNLLQKIPLITWNRTGNIPVNSIGLEHVNEAITYEIITPIIQSMRGTWSSGQMPNINRALWDSIIDFENDWGIDTHLFNRTNNICGPKAVKKINFENITSQYGSFLCPELYEIYNIKISNSYFNYPCITHDTLIRILEALYDYSDGDTHTITLGATNIAKLTPEELAIGQNKNWTIS